VGIISSKRSPFDSGLGHTIFIFIFFPRSTLFLVKPEDKIIQMYSTPAEGQQDLVVQRAQIVSTKNELILQEIPVLGHVFCPIIRVQFVSCEI
jgi:hypothetical protein